MKSARPYRLFALTFVAVLLFSGLLAGCASQSSSAASMDGMAMASTDQMPTEVKSAPTTVLQAYQYAAANPDTLKQIPCYCGCGKVGHTSNYSCYIQGEDRAGKITYDTHALGCGICVDITQDVMRLQKEKRSLQEIRTYIDQTYSKYGPSNITSGSVRPVSDAPEKPGTCDKNSLKPCTLSK